MSKKVNSIMAAVDLAAKSKEHTKDNNAQAENPSAQKKQASKNTAKKPTPTTRQDTSKKISREGRKSTTFWIREEALKQLKFLAVTDDTTSQALIDEAINDLFIKHGKPPIAAIRTK